MDYLEVRQTKLKGRGVFTTRDITQGEIIEVCPIIELPEEDTPHIDVTKLYNYYFNWGEKLNKVAIALGYGSLYNHSYKPNAIYEKDFNRNLLVFRSLSDIQAGEEITVNYNGTPTDKRPLWFTPSD